MRLDEALLLVNEAELEGAEALRRRAARWGVEVPEGADIVQCLREFAWETYDNCD